MSEEEFTSGERESFEWIQRSFTDIAVDQIYRAFIDANYEPSDEVLEAMSSITRSSHNEQRRYIAKMAKSLGSDLLSGHLRSDD